MERWKVGAVWITSCYLAVNTAMWLPHLMTEHSVHVRLFISEHEINDRQRRSTDTLPDSFDVTLNVGERNVTLSLRRITSLSQSLPVHTLRNGTLIEENFGIEEDSSFYEDTGRQSLILLQGQGLSGTYRQYTLFGTFLSGSERYIIQQSTNCAGENSGDILHSVTKMAHKSLQYNDDVIIPDNLIYTQMPKRAEMRSKRQTETYYIELYMVTDYSIYTFWKNRATGTNFQKDREAKQNIRKFYSYVLYGIDQRYRGITDQTYTLRVVSPGLLILDKIEDSTMTEIYKVNSSPRDIIGSSTVLDAFSEWVGRQGALPQRDHTMLFTNYDLVSGAGGDSAGIAFVEGLCSKQGQSVIEDVFSPFTMTTAAHELGHSLGADHDGVGNRCSSEDNYIMAEVNSVGAAPELVANLWIFSSCSLADFTTFINTLNRENKNCMTRTSPSSAPPSIDEPMAEAYPPDQICSFSEGEGSFVCRSLQDYSSLCASMYCKRVGTSHCYTVMPPTGTSCGRGKVCQEGKCVISPNAPLVPDDCPIGDQPGIISDYSATCADLVSSSPYRCYTSWTKKTCCESCATVYTGLLGCEYGDKAGWCKTLRRDECYSNADKCCGYCNSVKDTSRPGCEYGDHFSNCEARNCDFYNAASLEGCCETCGAPIKTTSTPTALNTTTTTTTVSTVTSTTSSTVSTSSTTKSTKVTSAPGTSRSTSPGTTVETPSDSLIIGVGAGIGVVVVIIIVVIIIFIFYKRRNRYIRKQSKSSDNAYDNIGFVKPSSQPDLPHHPPPRRDNSLTTSVRPLPLPVDRGAVRPPNLNFESLNGANDNGQSEVDGYMTPNSASVKTISNGVHYTAPDKPKFSFNLSKFVGEKRQERNVTTDNKDSPNSQRKPIHYRRSGESNGFNTLTNSTTQGATKQFRNSSTEDNSGQSADKFGPKTANAVHTTSDNQGIETDTYNEISEVANAFGRKNTDNDSREETDKSAIPNKSPFPKLLPKPKPRYSANEKGADKDTDSDSRPKVPLKPTASRDTRKETFESDFNPKVPLKPTNQRDVAKNDKNSETDFRPKVPLKSTGNNDIAINDSKSDVHPKVPLKPNKLANKSNASGTGLDSRPKVPSKPKDNGFEDDIRSRLDNLLAVDSSKEVKTDTPNVKGAEVIDSGTTDQDNDNKTKLPKPPMRPPLRPVPRRQKPDRKLPQDNPSFEDDNIVTV